MSSPFLATHEQWQLTFHLMKYLHSLVLAHPALPGAARAPLALQGRQCSPKWASQHSPSSHGAFSSQPFPKAPVLLQTPTLSSGAGELPQLQPSLLLVPGQDWAMGGHAKHPGGYGSSPLVSPARGTSAPLPGHGAVAQWGQTHEWQEGWYSTVQLLSGSGHAVGATHSIHTRKGGLTPAGNAAISK